VSRWGRFQDTDESAHYEFLCKSAGVPVHYCAESFVNDGSLSSLIMKALKRTMASEYSRELGVKIVDGQRRLTLLGFKQGGHPGYGLRRLLVGPDRQPKQLLARGERKSIATDRVILVPGPTHEVEVVRDIYRMFITDGLSEYRIACALNRKSLPYSTNDEWDYMSVHSILTHPKYAGCNVFGRTSSRLYTPLVSVPESGWTLLQGAFESLVDYSTFLEARKVIQLRKTRKSDEDLLESLRTLLARKGKLSQQLLKETPDMPRPCSYRHHFGGLRRAYELVGYHRSNYQFRRIDLRRRTQALREQLIENIAAMFPKQISIIQPGGRWRSRLRLRSGLIVSVVVARAVRAWKETISWQIDPVKHEQKYVTLLARLDHENRQVFDYHILPNIGHRRRFQIGRDALYLQRGLPLHKLSDLREVVARVRAMRTS
jgi:hypothetical protein